MRFFYFPFAMLLLLPLFHCSDIRPPKERIEAEKEYIQVHDAESVLEKERAEKESLVEKEIVHEEIMSCKEFSFMFHDFWQRSRDCKVDEDCVLVDFEGDCNCSHSLGGGVAINKKHKPEADKYFQWYLDGKVCPRHAKGCGYDIWEGFLQRCVEGKCTRAKGACIIGP